MENGKIKKTRNAMKGGLMILVIPVEILSPFFNALINLFSTTKMATCSLMSLVIILIAPLVALRRKRAFKWLFLAEAKLLSLAFVINGVWVVGVPLFVAVVYLVLIWDFPVATLDTK